MHLKLKNTLLKIIKHTMEIIVSKYFMSTME